VGAQVQFTLNLKLIGCFTFLVRRWVFFKLAKVAIQDHINERYRQYVGYRVPDFDYFFQSRFIHYKSSNKSFDPIWEERGLDKAIKSRDY